MRGKTSALDLRGIPLVPRLRLSAFFGSTVKYGHYHLYFCCSYRAHFSLFGNFILNDHGGREAERQQRVVCAF